MTDKQADDSEGGKRQVIRLKPNVFRCENGTEFVCGGTPKRCPVCGSTNIQIVPEVELDQCQR